MKKTHPEAFPESEFFSWIGRKVLKRVGNTVLRRIIPKEAQTRLPFVGTGS
jgi:hypothetical protein